MSLSRACIDVCSVSSVQLCADIISSDPRPILLSDFIFFS
jgi:hypothetical protein